jgi:hypothetical protein
MSFISCQGHHYGVTWPRSSPSSTKAPETDMFKRWEVSTLAKSYSSSLHRLLFKTSTCLPPVYVPMSRTLYSRSTYTYWSKLPCLYPNSTAWTFVSHRGHHYGETWPRSSPSPTKVPEPDMSQKWEASTLAKSYSNSLHCLLFETSTRYIYYTTALDSESLDLQKQPIY